MPKKVIGKATKVVIPTVLPSSMATLLSTYSDETLAVEARMEARLELATQFKVRVPTLLVSKKPVTVTEATWKEAAAILWEASERVEKAAALIGGWAHVGASSTGGYGIVASADGLPQLISDEPVTGPATKVALGTYPLPRRGYSDAAEGRDRHFKDWTPVRKKD